MQLLFNMVAIASNGDDSTKARSDEFRWKIQLLKIMYIALYGNTGQHTFQNERATISAISFVSAAGERKDESLVVKRNNGWILDPTKSSIRRFSLQDSGSKKF